MMALQEVFNAAAMCAWTDEDDEQLCRTINQL
jgi:hypothetical protein